MERALNHALRRGSNHGPACTTFAGAQEVADAVAPCGVGTGCTGDGYVPTDARTAGPGIDRLCGPVKYQPCKYIGFGGPGGQCVPKLANDVAPTFCR